MNLNLFTLEVKGYLKEMFNVSKNHLDHLDKYLLEGDFEEGLDSLTAAQNYFDNWVSEKEKSNIQFILDVKSNLDCLLSKEITPQLVENLLQKHPDLIDTPLTTARNIFKKINNHEK